MNSPHPGRWEFVDHLDAYFFSTIYSGFFLTSSVDTPLEYLWIYHSETTSLDIKKIKNKGVVDGARRPRSQHLFYIKDLDLQHLEYIVC